MVAFSFQKQFAEQILTGKKSQTIRATKRCEPGQTMQLFTGMRAKHCRRLGDALCFNVVPVKIFSDQEGYAAVQIGNEMMADPRRLDEFAQRDGFADFAAMLAFFAGRLPFPGWLYVWGDFMPTETPA